MRLWSRKALWRIGILMALVGGVIALGWTACVRMPGSSYRGALPPLRGELEQLGRELERDLRVLTVEIGERNHLCYTELMRAEEFLRGELGKTGLPLEVQAYTIAGRRFANLVAEKRGARRPSEVVVIGAHYDTVPGSPGANDNGSGAVGLLALARRWAAREPQRTLRFAAFVNEEPPFFQTDDMGSLRYARLCRERGDRILGMIALETMGCFSDRPGSQSYPLSLLRLAYPSEGNFIALVGAWSSRGFLRRTVEAFREHAQIPSEGACLPGWLPGIGWSDHWSFAREGYSAIMVTDTAPFRYPHYHLASDTLDKVDLHRLAVVVDGLDRALIALDAR